MWLLDVATMKAGLLRSLSQVRNVPNIRELTNYVILQAFYPTNLQLVFAAVQHIFSTHKVAEDSWLSYIPSQGSLAMRCACPAFYV